MKTYWGNIVTKEGIVRGGMISTENGIIKEVSENALKTEVCEDLGDLFIMPGFVDIHCHASQTNMAYDNPKEVADYHFKHGTTTMLMTLYRNLSHVHICEAIARIKKIMPSTKNVLGVHMEGPYLNSGFGTGSKTASQDFPDKSKYDEYLKSGIIKQWTSAPEIKCVSNFIKDITEHGVVAAIGHSCASYNEVASAHKNGARIETHAFDATGTTKSRISMCGTQDVSFDDACMLMDDMYYEVICDKDWVHLRKEKLKLLIKTVGINRIVAITDSFKGENDDKDITIINGELSGSKLTMDRVAENLFAGGYSLPEISMLTSQNACKALNLTDRGEIAVGKRADLIAVDSNARLIKVLV